ncbi:MAG: hypothetical protein AAF224_11650 [Pseudomonadota bacterium]
MRQWAHQSDGQWAKRAAALEAALTAFLVTIRKPWARSVGMAVAACLFVGGVIVSIAADPAQFINMRMAPVALAFFLVTPLVILGNAAEFVFVARLVGRRVTPFAALKITVFGTAANLLPLPGGAMVRVAALKTAGASVAGGSGGVLLAAIIWIGVSFILAGGGALLLGLPIAGGVGLLFGAGVLAACLVFAHFVYSALPAALGVCVVKSATTLLDALRLYWCLAALGVTASLLQAIVLSVSGVIGAAIAIAPAGLGVREGSAALLAQFIALPAAPVFLAASLARLVGLVMLAPLALLLATGEAKSANVNPSALDPS